MLSELESPNEGEADGPELEVGGVPEEGAEAASFSVGLPEVVGAPELGDGGLDDGGEPDDGSDVDEESDDGVDVSDDADGGLDDGVDASDDADGGVDAALVGGAWESF